jgi:hypothetical protein
MPVIPAREAQASTILVEASPGQDSKTLPEKKLQKLKGLGEGSEAGGHLSSASCVPSPRDSQAAEPSTGQAPRWAVLSPPGHFRATDQLARTPPSAPR